MTFTLRDATSDDYSVIARLFPALAVEEYPPTHEQFVARMLPTVVILEEDGRPRGYAFWRVHGATASVMDIVVDEPARGRGAGRMMMEEVRQRARAAGCSRWSLNVNQQNAVAIRLYERCGLVIEQQGWSMRAEWSQLASLPARPGDVIAYTPERAEDTLIVESFGETPDRLAILRRRTGLVLIGLREAGVPVGFAGFDPSLPGVYAIHLERAELARPLFDGLRAHAKENEVRLFVEGDHALYEALRAVGARVDQAFYRMGAALR